MSLRVPIRTEEVLLPPPYSLVTLREAGDAFEHACSAAERLGAGAIVWVRRYDVAEFAVVLEPAEPLSQSRRVFFAGMNALADALAACAPPQLPLTFGWPDAIRIDGVLVGGGRLGWPAGAPEDLPPPWLVFSGMIRTFVVRAGDPGMRPLLGGLDELGFESVDAGTIVAGFARHFMAGLHDWREDGFPAVARRYRARLQREADPAADLLSGEGADRRILRALTEASWRDPKTGLPWI